MGLLKKCLKWYFDLCRQTDLAQRADQRLHPRIWHKDFFVLRFINRNIRHTVNAYGLKGKSVLDLGSSHKPYEPLLHARRYVGVDYYNSEYAEIKADLNETQDFGEQFELVVCFDTMEHILHTNQLLGTVSKNIVPGGYVIITTPFLYGVHDAPYDFHRFTEYFYRNLPEKSLSLVDVRPSNTYGTSLIISINNILYRLPIPYFAKYPFYAVINIFGTITEYIVRFIAQSISAQWLQEFLWSGPLEYFAVYQKKK